MDLNLELIRSQEAFEDASTFRKIAYDAHYRQLKAYGFYFECDDREEVMAGLSDRTHRADAVIKRISLNIEILKALTTLGVREAHSLFLYHITKNDVMNWFRKIYSSKVNSPGWELSLDVLSNFENILKEKVSETIKNSVPNVNIQVVHLDTLTSAVLLDQNVKTVIICPSGNDALRFKLTCNLPYKALDFNYELN